MKNKKKNEFALSNDFIRTPNKMSLNNLQILGVMLSNFDWKGNDDQTIRIEVPTKEIIKILAESTNNRDYYYNALTNFQESSLVVRSKSNEIDEITGKRKEGYEMYMMIPYMEVTPERTLFEINNRLNKYIQLLKKNYTVFKIANTANFQSRYSYVLYMNLCSWNDHNISREDPIDERTRFYTTKQLKDMFDLSETDYTVKQKNGKIKFNRNVFERYVIQKAVNEINEYTDIQIKWWKEYDGRNVSRYVFWWVRTDGIDERTGLNKI